VIFDTTSHKTNITIFGDSFKGTIFEKDKICFEKPKSESEWSDSCVGDMTLRYSSDDPSTQVVGLAPGKNDSIIYQFFKGKINKKAKVGLDFSPVAQTN